MRPPACTQCKWGTGTTCERPSNTVAAKEMKTKLEQLLAERAKQDVKWFSVPPIIQEEKKEKTQ